MELDTMNDKSHGFADPIELEQHGVIKNDDEALARLGKKPVLKRSFGFMPMLGFSCTVLVTWEGVLLTFGVSYQNGGPAGAIYGFLVVWLGMACTYACLSELASMAPTSGGQYHWVSMLAPRKYQKFMSYITGWVTLCGWQAAAASGAFASGTFVQGLIVLCNPDYTPTRWQNTLFAWAILVFGTIINTLATGLLKNFEGLILILHIGGFFAILVPLVYLAPHNSAKAVFETFSNFGGWDNQTYSFFVGLVGPVYAFVGGDCAVHMAEEIKNAAVVVPRALMTSIAINGSLGFGMLLALLFSIGDFSLVPEVVLGSSLGFPFIQVFLDATASMAGSAVMASIVLVLGISATVGVLASSSRMFWAFARDRGLPFSPYISRVNSRTSIPVTSIMVTVIISALLSLVGIGSTVAFNNLVSITVVGLYASYLMAVGLLFYRRITNQILSPSSALAYPNVVNTQGASLVWGPFRMPGIFGLIVNFIAIVYLTITFIFAFWPGTVEVTAQTMNYSCLIFGGTVIFSVLYYVIYGRKTYQGPVINMD